jgi:hypothetical protein
VRAEAVRAGATAGLGATAVATRPAEDPA